MLLWENYQETKNCSGWTDIFIYLLASFNGVFSQSGEKLQTFYILFLDPCTNLFCVPVPKFYILIHVSVLHSLQIMKLFPRAIHTKDRFFKLGLWKLIPKIEVLKYMMVFQLILWFLRINEVYFSINETTAYYLLAAIEPFLI